MFYRAKSTKTCERQLQGCLRKIEEWCIEHGFKFSLSYVRLGYCFTLYQRLWLYNGASIVAFYDMLGIRKTYPQLQPRKTLCVHFHNKYSS